MTSTQQLHQLALQAINQQDYINAHKYCVALLQTQPDHADSYFLLGIINSEVGQFNKAIKLIEKALSLDPQIEYFAYLAKCLSLKGDMQAALKAANQVSIESTDKVNILDTVAVALSRIGDHQLALGYFEKALQLEKHNPQYFYNYAVSSKFAGKFEQAAAAFEQAIALKPDFYAAYFALSDIGLPDPKQHRLERLKIMKVNDLDADAGLFIGHALAKEYELHGEYQRAFAVLEMAKKQKREASQYDFAADRKIFEMARTLPRQQTKKGEPSKRPIFVIGMPRSGTTLVERILSSHSDVASGGELQDFGIALKELSGTTSPTVLDIETLTAGAAVDPLLLGQRYIQRTKIVGPRHRRFVDKLPFNFFYLPLIRQALPNAKIICMLRDPLDTCIGNFRQLFSMNSPYYQYSLSLDTIGLFYQQFYQLALDYQKQQDDNFLIVNYQQLVSDPEQQIRELVRFCDLPWQDACLKAEDNPTPVSTASKVQVREAINTRSLGRWKRYRPHTDVLEAWFKTQGVD